ncbi:hypothetical protein ACS49_02325, partial [Bacillus cereus]
SITTQVEVTSQEEEGNGEHTEGIAAIYQLLNDESHRPKKDTESSEVFNSKAVKLGKLPDDPEFVKELEAELQQKDEAQKDQNPEKTLMEEYEENFKVDPAGEDTPARESLPLPQKTAFDLKREITKIQDSRAKVKLNAVQASLPSTC